MIPVTPEAPEALRQYDERRQRDDIARRQSHLDLLLDVESATRTWSLAVSTSLAKHEAATYPEAVVTQRSMDAWQDLQAALVNYEQSRFFRRARHHPSFAQCSIHDA